MCCAQSVAGSSPRSSSSEKDAEEGGALGRLSVAQRHQLAVLLDTAMLKVRDVATQLISPTHGPNRPSA